LGLIPLGVVLLSGDNVSPGGASLGVPLIVSGSLLFLKASLDLSRRGGTTTVLKRARTLVREGVYRRSRNPIYLSVILISLGEALLFLSMPLFLYTLLLFLGLHLWVVLVEEPLLKKAYGSEFDVYRREVPRWVASPRKWICWGRRRRSRSAQLSP